MAYAIVKLEYGDKVIAKCEAWDQEGEYSIEEGHELFVITVRSGEDWDGKETCWLRLESMTTGIPHGWYDARDFNLSPGQTIRMPED